MNKPHSRSSEILPGLPGHTKGPDFSVACDTETVNAEARAVIGRNVIATINPTSGTPGAAIVPTARQPSWPPPARYYSTHFVDHLEAKLMYHPDMQEILADLQRVEHRNTINALCQRYADPEDA